MRILVVCSGNAGYISPFIKEQADSISALGNNVLIYPIIGKGILGYLINLKNIKKKIRDFKPDLIHAHYGLSGLLACFQRLVPTIITFHGSDGYILWVRILSKIASRLSAFNIFVGVELKRRIKGHKRNIIIPCGVELEKFYPIEKNIVRNQLNFSDRGIYILFSSSFDDVIKNYPLAKKALEKIQDEINLIEMKGKTREEVNLLLNACDLLLLTSISEGSPQIIKEAMACNCPIVATDVGDIRWLLRDTVGCYIVSFDPDDIADKIKMAIEFSKNVGRTNGRDRIIKLGLDSETIAKKIMAIYEKVLNKN